jgi:F0F1-type ATP synthase membrane subunit b/b'
MQSSEFVVNIIKSVFDETLLQDFDNFSDFLIDVKNQVGSLVIEVAEKVLRKELSNKADQEGYIKQLADGVKLN